ncbi:hypothetical protein, conserved [Eimeria tenella]|uniref:Transmembrane protein n=1 Tax=Eimeria tenella TaxID=5802 RepID=U6KMM6_EIMTE|nr:hypothetical protein, conserved [Eimeria tenella]CDJ37527.1 hypothetical protein, conserved [Eimeria tenella]|eukprot:XP_013228365.1 hypothetical protein, conserved [Eimeria tenella]
MATARDAVQCLMLCVAVLAAFSCISRPDCNFPLYLYFWWVFFYVPEDRKRQQRSMVFFMMLSCVQDIIFLLYWPPRWLAHEWLAVSSAEEGVHILSTVLGLIELGLKVLILALLLVPSITENTAEMAKRWSSSNGLIRLEMPAGGPPLQQLQQQQHFGRPDLLLPPYYLQQNFSSSYAR